MAIKVIIPASLDTLKPRASPLEGLADADGLGTDPEDEEGVAPVALAYGDWMSVTEEKRAESNVP